MIIPRDKAIELSRDIALVQTLEVIPANDIIIHQSNIIIIVIIITITITIIIIIQYSIFILKGEA